MEGKKKMSEEEDEGVKKLSLNGIKKRGEDRIGLDTIR